MSLDWRGDKVLDKMRAAQKLGVNATMAASVIHAKTNHDWQNRTGTLEGSIKIAEYAHRSGDGMRGTWGSSDVRYALIHELGGKIVPKTAAKLHFEVEGRHVMADSVRIPARPYLRPAADAQYPGLAANIRKAYGGRI